MSDDNILSYERLREARLQTSGSAAADSPRQALRVDDGAWTEAAIRPRPWLIPGLFLRGAVTLIAGPGGAGKSGWCCGLAVAMALGVPYGRLEPVGVLRTLLYNVEDDLDEQQRRLSAALRPHDRTPAAITGNIIRVSPEGVGTLLERDPITGAMVQTAAWAQLESLIRDRRPDVVFLDPLVELHSEDENDNAALRLVIAHLRGLAARYQCAVVLIHHLKKGGSAGDPDSIRGAGAIMGAVRAGATILAMSEEEAEEVGISIEHRRSYVRVDDAKQNYAPASAASWHEIVEYQLDNGEGVAAVIPWSRPTVASGPAPEAMALIMAELERGLAGSPYSPRLSDAEPRSVGPILAKHGIVGERAQKAAVKGLYQRGWVMRPYQDKAQRRERYGLQSPDGLPAVEWREG